MSYRTYLPPDLPKPVRDSLQQVYDRADLIRRSVESIQQAGYITREEAEARFGVKALLPQIQLTGGATALNVEGLLGVLAQPQKAGIPSYDALPDVLLSQDGELAYVKGIVYRFNGTTEPGFWEPITTKVIQDTHANRLLLHPASSYSEGVLFFETDRQILYVTRKDSLGTMYWWFVSGIYITDWSTRNLECTNGDQGMFYYADDRNVLYQMIDATGTVNTSGTAVTATDGQRFYTDWPADTYIIINNATYQIDTVSTTTTLTLKTSAGVQTGVSYKVYSGAWKYLLGVVVDSDTAKNNYIVGRADAGLFYHTTDPDRKIEWKYSWASWGLNGWLFMSGWERGDIANIPLATIGAGYIYHADDYWHSFISDGLNWEFLPGDPGSKYIVAGIGTPPIGGLWALCNGSAVNVANSDGTVSSVTTPNMTGDVFIQGGAYSGSQDAAAAAKWDTGAATDSGGAHTHSTDSQGSHAHDVDFGTVVSAGPSATTEVQSGTGSTVASSGHTHDVGVGSVLSASAGAHTHTAQSDGAHTHTLSDANAKLKAPSETNGGVPLRIKMSWYMRR